jgi:arginase family enzyme
MSRMDVSGLPHLRPPPAAAAPSRVDPDVPTAAAWLANGSSDPSVIVLGVPYCGGSISRARTDLTPAAVRGALARFTVWSSDAEVSLEDLAVADAGDIEPADGVEAMQARIAGVVGGLRDRAPVPLAVVGGDNSITVGLVRGAGADTLLTFDTHHDCRDPAHGATNGSPVRQLVEGGLERVAQIGIHGFANGRSNALWAREHGVRWFLATTVRSAGIQTVLEEALALLDGAERIWVDVDVDALDRAFAPGAPASLAGGMWPADLERAAFLLGRNPRVVGMDIVEVDPDADVAATTVRAACGILLSFLAGVAAR